MTKEQEIVIITAVLDLIDDMVNYQIFDKLSNTEHTMLTFHSSIHQRLFNIILADFLSYPRKIGNSLPFNLPAPPLNPPSERTYLFYLRQICETPRLSWSADVIRGPVESFADWLDADALIEKVWLPPIDQELSIRVARIEFLKICGDIAKHNFSRLQSDVRKICNLLRNNGYSIVDEATGYSILSGFYEWFHEDVFAYHSSTAAEFLNDIRWGIFAYLQPEFRRAFQRIDDTRYQFKIPPEITEPVARAMYWDLLNRIRVPPSFPKFTVDPVLKRRY